MTTNEALDKYLCSLSPRELIAKSRDIRTELCISPDVLSNWRRGRTVLRPVYPDKISEILGVDLSANVDGMKNYHE